MRAKARELTLKLLFQMDLTGQTFEEVLSLARSNIKANEAVWELAEEKLRGIVENLSQIDDVIKDFTKKWGEIERLTYIDRNILRIATYEFLHEPETPTGVVIAEAVRLAELYGTENSARFVNGVLSSMAKNLRKNGANT
ncbi:MAG: transcription antitermination factor NusB [bacterium]